jgi:hypothetical protein
MPFTSSTRSTFGALSKTKVFSKPQVFESNLILSLDAFNPNSYNGSGTNWLDVSENNRVASFVNTPTWNSQGWFDIINTSSASASYFTLDDNLISQTASGDVSFTLESVFYIYEPPQPGPFTSTGYCVIGHDSALGFGQQLTSNPPDSSSATFLVNFGGRSTGNFSASLSLFTNTWYHAITTREAPNVNSLIYINGDFATSISEQGQPTSGISVLDPGVATLNIGYSPLRVPGLFNGRISYISVYNTYFDQSMVQQNFNALRNRYNI